MVALERALEIDRFPEPAETGQFRGAQLRRSGERAAEPAEQSHQREDVVAVVREHAGQRRGPTRAQKIEVERRDQAAGDVVLTLHPDHFALQRRQSTIGEARRPHPPRRPQEVQMG